MTTRWKQFERKRRKMKYVNFSIRSFINLVIKCIWKEFYWLLSFSSSSNICIARIVQYTYPLIISTDFNNIVFFLIIIIFIIFFFELFCTIFLQCITNLSNQRAAIYLYIYFSIDLQVKFSVLTIFFFGVYVAN